MRQQYFELRSKAIKDMIASGEQAYPHKFVVDISLPTYVEKYKGVADGERVETIVSIAGASATRPASAERMPT